MSLTSSGGELHVEEVLEATVVLHNARVGHGHGGEQQAALLLAGRAVGGHRDHVKVTALPLLSGDLDGELEALALLPVEELVQVVGLPESLSFLLRSWWIMDAFSCVPQSLRQDDGQ